MKHKQTINSDTVTVSSNDEKFGLQYPNHIHNMSIKKINDNFSYGTCADFSVVIMNSNGYISATKLCKDADKYFAHWKINSFSKQLVKETSKLINISECDLMISIGKKKV